MKKTTAGNRAFLLLGAMSVLTVPDMALAQEKETSGGGLEEIVVTARKREENLQSAPLSVAAIGGDTLEKAGIDEFSEIASRVPGFTFNPDNVSEPNIFLRGIGTDIESAASNPAIGFFLNDVYLSRAQGTAIELFDLERVEIVRGPQGTLYGKNVVGGAINFITRKPTDEFRAGAEAGFGNYGSFEVKANVAGGLGDGLSGSIAASARHHDGYARNTFTGNNVEDLDAYGVMAQLRYQPDDRLDILLTGDLTRRRGGGKWVDIQTPSDHNIPFVNPERRRGPNNIDGKQDADLGGVHLSANYDTGSGTITSVTAYREGKFASVNNDAGSFIDFTKMIYGADGRIDFGAIDHSLFNDDYYINDKDETAKSFSQDLRFRSDFDGPFNLLAGLYYQHESVDRTEIADYIFVEFYAQGKEIAETRLKSDTWAAFAEGTFDITDTLGVTAGIRYTKDRKRFSVYRETIGDFLGAEFEDENGNFTRAFSASSKQSWDAWTPSVNLHWQPAKDVYVYGLVSKGYKSGGWNGENATNPGEARLAYDPEYAWNYELGTKTTWLDNRLRFNVTGFWTEYKDLQTQQFVIFDPNLPADNVISNAGKARVKGIELETALAPVDGVTLFANYTYMDAKITGDLISTELQYDPSCFCSVPVPTNLKGNRLRRSPKNSFSVGGDVTVPVSSRINAFVRADYNWTDDFFFDNENSPRTRQKSVGVLNGSIGIATEDDKWELRLWAKNLTNELYESGKSDVIGSVLVSYNPPRTYGVTLRWKY
ncbi:TonB-dependent receptor [Sphingopyxis sp. USTB-05]|jgi:iron complex outermembrane receptor protein|uniref:TonB-dependent receptor n=2 Tax=unclassified Sphingopyxis TaxID=2614943 RepID=UPI0006BF6077|nr:TonB-dependent receptor [Sphingopyxis sp. USTB-05]USI77982.1 TonB-dependent receptor [Sphingopyxis sp. USTB-05]GAO79648.1 outer membrane receptor proteins, mostly Fe transport [Sphingopyxis sp. C-1]